MKKAILSIISVLIFISVNAQKYNLEDGFMADGYDVVSYFSKKAIKGKSSYVIKYGEAKYKFSTEANKNKFKANPSKYAPQYGGWCAYALSTKNKKVAIDPETFEIRNGKLYLFYNSWGSNALDSWIKEGPEKLIKQGDINWKNINK